MELARLLAILRKNRQMLILLCLSATVNAVILTYFIAEKYEGKALVAIRPPQVLKLGKEMEVKQVLDFPVSTMIPFEAMGKTYRDIIESHAVAERIVRALQLDHETTETRWFKRLSKSVKKFFKDAWTYMKYGRLERGSELETAIEELQDSLTVVAARDTYVFEIKYLGPDPQVAAAVANKVAEVFVEHGSEIDKLEARKSRQFIESRLQESRRVLEDSRRALQQFKQDHAIAVLDKELSAKISSLSEFETSLENSRKEVAGAEAEIAQTRKLLSSQAEFLRTSVKVTDNPLVTSLKADLSKLEVDLAGSLERFTPMHPQVLSLKAKITEAQSKLKREVARVVSEETSSVNSVQQKLLESLLLSEATLESLQAKRKRLEGIVDRRRTELRGSPPKQTQLAKLELEVAIAEEAYKLINMDYENSVIREAERRSDIRVVSPATPPTYPARPIKVYYAGLALSLALMLGIGFVVFVEFMGPAVRVSAAGRGESGAT